MEGNMNNTLHLVGGIAPTENMAGEVVALRGLKGEQGERGYTGNGISSAILNDDYTLTITFTDGDTYTTPSIRGEKGDNGADGKDGADGYTPQKNIDYFDGADGKDGTNGVDGKDGINGADGEDGVGIVSIEKTATVGLVDTYTITLSDGSTYTFTVTNGSSGSGSGDMTKAVYDTNNDGVVDASDVAYSVDWSGVTNKPTIPSNTSDLTNDSGFIDSSYHDSTKADTTHNHDGTYSVLSHTHTWNNITDKPASFTPSSHTHTKSEITDFPILSSVATSGSYNDLSNKPIIPTVNNATLTIQKNGTTVKTFTANASSNVTANITVPTKTSDITNDSGFIDSSYHDSSKADVSHTQSASTISAGTLGGKVLADSTSVGTLSDSQVRNITISSSEPTSADGNNGDIWIVI